VNLRTSDQRAKQRRIHRRTHKWAMNTKGISIFVYDPKGLSMKHTQALNYMGAAHMMGCDVEIQ
jgi:hypothetical protein